MTLLHCVKIDRPVEWPIANIYTLADEHNGDPNSDEKTTIARVEQIKNDPYGLCVLNGDLLNMALRNSVSDVYGATRPPQKQEGHMTELLRTIVEKIIGATDGNHEYRGYKEAGIDPMLTLCQKLGIETLYAPEGILMFLRFGKALAHAHHKETNLKQWYSVYATHGSGGGRKEGAKAIRLADMAAIVDADVYIHSHTHLPMVMKQAYYRASSSNCSVQLVEKLFVNTGASMDYGAYAQAFELKPASKSTPVIHLDARTKRATATL
jgi:hypothetical protein